MRPTLALPVLLTLSACSGSDPKVLTDEGVAALESGNPEAAVAKFVDAISRMESSDPDYLRACVSRCRALARIEPPRAQREFLELADRASDQIREVDFAAMANELVKENAIPDAVSVAQAGIEMFPGSTGMKSLRDSVGEAAKKAKDPESLKRLQGLGYVGGDR